MVCNNQGYQTNTVKVNAHSFPFFVFVLLKKILYDIPNSCGMDEKAFENPVYSPRILDTEIYIC